MNSSSNNQDLKSTKLNKSYQEKYKNEVGHHTQNLENFENGAYNIMPATTHLQKRKCK